MTVGTLGTIYVNNITAHSIDIYFGKNANVSKYKYEVIDANTNVAEPARYKNVESLAISDKVLQTIPNLSPLRQYYIYVTPINGTTLGVRKQYTGSSGNKVQTKSDTALTQPAQNVAITDGGPVDAFLRKVSNTLLSNGGTSISGSSSKIDPNAGAGSLSSAPQSLNSTSRQHITVSGLKPNQTYDIQIIAEAIDEDGNIIKSLPSAKLTINTPQTAVTGNNFKNTNSISDTTLSGGSIVASSTTDPLGINTGSINFVTDTIGGTGVILNQSGLAGFKSGVKQFYIDANNGDAYFAGTLSVGSLTDAGGVTSSSLSSTLSGYRTTTSTIGAGYIQTGILKSGNWPTGAGSSGFYNNYGHIDETKLHLVTQGTAIDLDTGTISSTNFSVNSLGEVAIRSSDESGNYIEIDSNEVYGLSALQTILYHNDNWNNFIIFKNDELNFIGIDDNQNSAANIKFEENANSATEISIYATGAINIKSDTSQLLLDNTDIKITGGTITADSSSPGDVGYKNISASTSTPNGSTPGYPGDIILVYQA